VEVELSAQTLTPCPKMKLANCAELCVNSAGHLLLDEQVNALGDQFTMENCDNLVKIFMPKVENILSGVFTGCDNLEEVHAPKLRLINSWSFAHTPKLKTVYAPELAEVKGDAFHSATSLEKISVNELLLSDLIGKDAFKETSCDERNNDCFEQIA